MSDPFKPSPPLLISLGSLIIHYEEWTSDKGNPVDKQAIDTIRRQPDVEEWINQMSAQAFLPLKR